MNSTKDKISFLRYVLILAMAFLSIILFVGCSGKNANITQTERESPYSVESATYIFDNKNHSIEVEGLVGGETVYYSLISDGAWSEDNFSFSKVGAYKLYFKIVDESGAVTYLNATLIICYDDGSITEPDKPTDPEPTEPDEPIDSEPTDPEPTEPDEPTDPEPTEPDKPIDPEPTTPDEPTDPEPIEPDEPIDPEPTEPDKPIDPEPTEPDEPTDPEPTVPDEPTDPEPTEPDKPIDPEPTTPDEPTDPEPTVPDEPTDPEQTDPDKPIDPEPTEPEEKLYINALYRSNLGNYLLFDEWGFVQSAIDSFDYYISGNSLTIGENSPIDMANDAFTFNGEEFYLASKLLVMINIYEEIYYGFVSSTFNFFIDGESLMFPFELFDGYGDIYDSLYYIPESAVQIMYDDIVLDLSLIQNFETGFSEYVISDYEFAAIIDSACLYFEIIIFV